MRLAAPWAIFPDLLGFRPVPAEHHIEWSRLFDAPVRRRRAAPRKSTADWSGRRSMP